MCLLAQILLPLQKLLKKKTRQHLEKKKTVKENSHSASTHFDFFVR